MDAMVDTILTRPLCGLLHWPQICAFRKAFSNARPALPAR
jgi:hypothetical protein